MPKLTPPPRNTAEDKAISEALRRDKKDEKAARAAAKPKESVLALLVAAAAVAAGAYYGLNYLNRDDDLQPIRPPEPTQMENPPSQHTAPKPNPPVKSSGSDHPPAAKSGADKPRDAKVKEPARTAGEASDAVQGLLAVTCNPECEIEIDGRPTGKRSPQSGLLVPAGAHKLRLVNTQLHLSTTDSVTVTADETTTRHYNLVLGSK